MKKAIFLLLLLLGACAGPGVNPVPPQKEQPSYNAPDWSTDETIALINSKVSTVNQQILLTSMREILDRELQLFADRIRGLQNLIDFQEAHLKQIIADYPETGMVPTPEDEENFVAYCASAKVQIELLKIQKIHEEDLNHLLLAINRLTISLPEEH